MSLYDEDDPKAQEYLHRHKETMKRVTCLHREDRQAPSAYDKGAVYCLDCGLRMIAPPGPIRFPTYDEAMEDARRLNWRRMEMDAPMPLDRPCYIAGKDDVTGNWRIRRWRPGQNLIVWSERGTGGGFNATHWCPDLLGLPTDS